MKKYFIKLFTLIAIALFLTNCVSLKVDSTQQKSTTIHVEKEVSTFVKLASIENVFKVEKRPSNSHFKNNYEIWFQQPIDYNDLSKGTFPQRILLGYVGD